GSGCGGCWGGYGGYGGHYAGCWGAGYACYGGCGGYDGAGYAPIPTTTVPSGEPIGKPKADDGKKKKGNNDDQQEQQTRAASRARLIVRLPEGAKLYIDDLPVKASPQRTFSTPALKKGQAYYYDVRADVVRNG